VSGSDDAHRLSGVHRLANLQREGIFSRRLDDAAR
jgi:hypothetical protein